MDPIEGRKEKSNKLFSTKKRRNKKKKRGSLQGGGNLRLSVWYLSKFKLMRFFYHREMLILLRRKSKKEQQKREGLVKNTARMKEQEGRVSTCFRRDPDAKFCIICGDDQERHLELMCPYNYLSPDAYVPCRVRHALWGNYTTTLRYRCLRHKEEEQREPPTHDEMNSRRLGFLQCLVRVNNLPERCHPEQLAMLFSQFGPLRMWHVAMCSSGACKGYGCVIFHHHEHADAAIEVLNCYEFGKCKLRVDWAFTLV